MDVVARAWRRWTRIAHAIGNFQARLILTLFYVFVLGPFALALRLGADPLGIKRPGRPVWRPRPTISGDPATWGANQA